MTCKFAPIILPYLSMKCYLFTGLGAPAVMQMLALQNRTPHMSRMARRDDQQLKDIFDKLSKSPIFFLMKGKMSHSRLQRSFSSSNLHATQSIHQFISKQELHQGLKSEVTKSSMIIPTFDGLRKWNRNLPEFVMNLLVNIDVLNSKGRLVNWCRGARSLVPLNTDADGNCLLHSISIYVFGVHDRELNLRRFIYQKLMAENRSTGKIYTRWKAEQEIDIYSGEMRTDWKSVVQAAFPTLSPYGSQGPPLQSLEAVHIFTASSILARPIIVICDEVHRSLEGRSFQLGKMGGIYLPLLRDPSECEKTPIVLCYWENHFMPLLSVEDFDLVVTAQKDHPKSKFCIPLVYEDLSRMPVRFLLDDDIEKYLVQAYLDCMDVPLYDGECVQKPNHVSAARLKFNPAPTWSFELVWSLSSLAKVMFNESLNKPTSPSGELSPLLPSASLLPVSWINIPRPKPAGVIIHPKCRKKRTSRTCFKTLCSNPGFYLFEGLCRSCYHEKISGSSIEDLTSPFDEKLAAATCRKKSGVPPVEASEQCRRRNEPRDNSRVFATAGVAQHSHVVAGSQLCQSGQGKADCMTEGCRNKATDEEVPLCKKCCREQIYAWWKKTTREKRACFWPSGSLKDHVVAASTTWQCEQDFPEMSRPGRISASSGNEMAITHCNDVSDLYAEPSNVPPPLRLARITPPIDTVPSDVIVPDVFVVEAFEQGRYSLPSAVTRRCTMAGCDIDANEKLNGLCDRCYQQSVKKKEVLQTEKERQVTRVQMQPPARPSKLQSDSPDLNPVPYKTLGCPHMGIPEHEFMCIICHGKAIGRADRTLANREPPAYGEDVGGGAFELGSRQQPKSESIYDEPRTLQELGVGPRQPSEECSTPGCRFFASPEYGTLCSKCFLEKIKHDAIRPKQDWLVGYNEEPHFNPIDSLLRPSIRFRISPPPYQDVQMVELNSKLQLLETTSYDGKLIWKIDNYQRRKQDAVMGYGNAGKYLHKDVKTSDDYGDVKFLVELGNLQRQAQTAYERERRMSQPIKPKDDWTEVLITVKKMKSAIENFAGLPQEEARLLMNFCYC
eukprot:gene10488-11587_t